MRKRQQQALPSPATAWERFRNLLLQERARILRETRSLLPHLGRGERLSDEDQIRAAHDEFIVIEEHRIKLGKLRQIEEALRRIEEGLYGVCQDCGEEISAKRLAAVPWARLCIVCQDRAAAADALDVPASWPRISY